MSMLRRNFLASSAAAALPSFSQSGRRPNIIYLMADELGYFERPSWEERIYADAKS